MASAPLPDDSLEFIRDRLANGQIRWTYHVSMRLAQRGLNSGLLLDFVDSLEIIESYPDDKCLPSFLLRGESGATVYHVQIALDLENNNVRVVKVYVPHPNEWDESKRVRQSNK